MTAKEKLEIRINSLGLSDRMKESIWREINEYAVEMAEKAVEDEVLRKDTGYLFTSWSEEVGRNILSRIKTLTGNE